MVELLIKKLPIIVKLMHRYHFHKTPPLDHTLNHLTTVHTLTYHF
jgi:hypothetical protein